MSRFVLSLVFLLVFSLPVFAQPAEVRQAANALIEQGFFDKCALGDARACSYFVRLLVYQLNPAGDPSRPGALRKGGGHEIDGYAEDALALNANPADLFNVVDAVGGTGAPGARFQWDGPKPRREHDKWEAPRPLSQAELNYLRPGSTVPAPVPAPAPLPSVPVDLIQRLRAIEDAIRELSGDLLDREYVINSIDGFKSSLADLDLQLQDVRKQNAMVIEQLNTVIAELSKPVTLKGPWGITFKKQ